MNSSCIYVILSYFHCHWYPFNPVTLPSFILVLVVCLCLVSHNSQLTGPFLSPSSLFHLSSPPLLFPGRPPALTQPPSTRPPLLLPLPFLSPPPRWLPLPHPHLLPRPSSGRGLLRPSPAQNAFPISSCEGALTATGTGRWGRGRERFGLIQLPPPPTTTCPLPLPLPRAWSRSMGMPSLVGPTIAPCWPTFTLQPDSSLPRSSPGTLRGRGRRQMTQVWEREIFSHLDLCCDPLLGIVCSNI